MMKTSTQPSPWQSFTDKRAIIMLFLGFAAGIPILLIFSSLSLWLREAGVDRSTVTMFSWAALGYSFKFIWAPLIDALPVPVLTRWLGRRRAWMLVAQFGVIAAILTMASVNPSSDAVLKIMAIGAVLLGFSSATQDIVIDAYRIELAPPSMQSILSAMYTTGYRIGMIVAGAGALYLADYFGSTETAYSYVAWRNTYWVMAAVMVIGVLTTLTVHEPSTESLAPKKLARNQTIMAIYAALALLPAIVIGLIYLVGIILFKLFGVAVVHTMITLTLPVLSQYEIFMAVLMPVALVYLLLQQPTFTSTKIIRNVDTTATEKIRLFLVFVLAVIGFVVTFSQLSSVLPDVSSVAGKFLFEIVHMVSSLVTAFVVGWLLVKLGAVRKQVAVATWVEPIVDFFNRYGKKALLLLALIGLYRIADIVAGVISNVFYQDMGFSKTDIATAVKLVGVWVTIGGGFLGGILAQRMRIMHAMMVGAILASLTNLFFVLLTFHPADLTYMYIAVVADNLAAGLASAVFIAFLSALTSIRFTAVQYAIFSSLMTLLPKVIGGYSGTIVDNTSYPFFFIFCCLIGVPVLLLVYLVDKKVALDDKAAVSDSGID